MNTDYWQPVIFLTMRIVAFAVLMFGMLCVDALIQLIWGA